MDNTLSTLSIFSSSRLDFKKYKMSIPCKIDMNVYIFG